MSTESPCLACAIHPQKRGMGSVTSVTSHAGGSIVKIWPRSYLVMISVGGAARKQVPFVSLAGRLVESSLAHPLSDLATGAGDLDDDKALKHLGKLWPGLGEGGLSAQEFSPVCW